MSGVSIDNLSYVFTQPGFNTSLIRELPKDVYDASLNALGAYLNLGFNKELLMLTLVLELRQII
jgi:hypothetical protein